MTHEASKAVVRRSHDIRFATRYFRGDGIDIGAGNDCLGQFSRYFPLMRSCRAWDLPDGDAMTLTSVADMSYDFVHSSHCLEHLVDPYHALNNWIRVCRQGGHLVLMIPDEDLYEQGVWPSTYGVGHNWSFTIHKRSSWSPVSINVFELLKTFDDDVDVLKVELLDTGNMRHQPRWDQTLGPLAESAIEIVLRRRVKLD